MSGKAAFSNYCPACQRHIGVIFADMEIDHDKLAAAIFLELHFASFLTAENALSLRYEYTLNPEHFLNFFT